MTIVECIKDDWTLSKRAKLFVELGEPTPKVGERYTLDTYVHLEDVSEYENLG